MEEQKKSYYNCSVDGCLNSTLNSELSFFKLPAITERRNEWLTLIQREDLIDSTNYRIRVCEAHFKPNFIKKNSIRKLLKRNANPQLLLPLSTNVANKATQAITETADANEQCNFEMNAEEQTPLHSPLKRNLLNKLQCCQKRLKTTNKTESEANTFLMLCDKLLTPNLARVVKQQIKTQRHENRYNLDYNIFCLNLYYASPHAYSLLKDTLCLSSKQTLTEMYGNVTTKTNSHIMDFLKTKVQYMSDMDRNCTLVIDAIKLKVNLFYNIKEDRIYGFHEVDGVQSPEPAKYALVLMIQGLFENYKQPVGFALLSELCLDNPSVTNWIDKLILELFSIGFHVRSLVSNTGSDFFNSATKRSVSVERPFFFVGDRKIYYIFDPPHLITLLRNNLIKYEFHFGNYVAKWHHILQFYDMDKLKRLRLAPKLTDSHFKPTNIGRTQLKYAVQVLSASVAASISTYKDFGIIENSAEGTTKLIDIMNDLFDFLNTSSRHGSKKYQNAFHGEEYQIDFINSMLNFFASLTLINPNNGQNVTSEVKFIEGFLITLKSLLMLFEDLRIEGCSYVLTGRLNQDCLETFFINSTKPTSWQLVSAFRKIFFVNILKSSKECNCTEDLTKCLLDSEKIYAPLGNEAGDSVNTSTMVFNRKENESSTRTNLISTVDYNTLDLPENKPLVYVSAYLLRKCLDHHNKCNKLVSYTEGKDNAQNFSQDNTFTHYKDYCKDGTKNLLTVPPDSFVKFVRAMEERFCNFFVKNYLNCKILKSLLEEVQTLTFTMSCECFPLAYCKKLYIRMRIYYTLKDNNRAFRQCRNHHKIFSVTSL